MVRNEIDIIIMKNQVNPLFGRSIISTKRNPHYCSNQSKCSENYIKYINDGNAILNNTLCAAGPDGIDACQGDTGAPLMFRDSQTGIWSENGIVFFGIGCENKDFPSVYTKVASFIDWINTVTGLKF